MNQLFEQLIVHVGQEELVGVVRADGFRWPGLVVDENVRRRWQAGRRKKNVLDAEEIVDRRRVGELAEHEIADVVQRVLNVMHVTGEFIETERIGIGRVECVALVLVQRVGCEGVLSV